MITEFDHDTLFQILSFLPAADLDHGISLTCKTLYQEAHAPELWRKLCIQTGKWYPGAEEEATHPAKSTWNSYYFDLYHQIPCVPLDVRTITQALRISKPGGTITLWPGVYNEHLVIRNSVLIRAAKPQQRAAIVWHATSFTGIDNGYLQQPKRNQSVLEVTDACSTITLQDLTLLHYSRGTDIWNGNCAIYCHGVSTNTLIDRCSIQSDSGRGIVVSNGAAVQLVQSTIHDCAATGLYVGDNSTLTMTSCNLVRNGFGRLPLHLDEEDMAETAITRAGHSGLYVEAAEASIKDTLIADNCLTGMSVVRQGIVKICQSHVVGNGHDPIVVFEDAGAISTNDAFRGGVFEHTNYFDRGLPSQDELEATMIRCPNVPHRPLSRTILKEFYRN